MSVLALKNDITDSIGALSDIEKKDKDTVYSAIIQAVNDYIDTNVVISGAYVGFIGVNPSGLNGNYDFSLLAQADYLVIANGVTSSEYDVAKVQYNSVMSSEYSLTQVDNDSVPEIILGQVVLVSMVFNINVNNVSDFDAAMLQMATAIITTLLAGIAVPIVCPATGTDGSSGNVTFSIIIDNG